MKALNGQSMATPGIKIETTQASNGNGRALLQSRFISQLLFHGPGELSGSLKRIHDIALYHSNIPLEQEEKAALYDLKILWDSLEDLSPCQSKCDI